jgi:phosphohistidine swiveling domain-containing protein
MTGEIIGRGQPVATFPRFSGRVRNFRAPDDVLDALDDELEEVIAVVESGGTTFLSPILARLGAIVCRSGTMRSHLAIVSREYELPCVIAAQIPPELADGTLVMVEVADADTAVISLGAAQEAQDTSNAATSAGLVQRWLGYIRRTPDAQGYKHWDLGRLTGDEIDELIAYELTDEDVSDLVWHMGCAFKPEITRRSAFTSELFPMTPYMTLSTIDTFYQHADRVRMIEQAKRAEQIGRESRTKPTRLNYLWTWMAGYHFLCGREELLHLGLVGPQDRFEDVRTVVDFWRRLALSQRGDGTLDNKDVGDANRYLSDEQVTSIVQRAVPVDGDERKRLIRLVATIAGYAFLYYTDSRVGICDSGPYPLDDRRSMIVREFHNIGPGFYPWSEGLDPPFPRLTVGLIFDPRDFQSLEINDWGTTFVEPEPFLAGVREAVVIGHSDDGVDTLLAPDDWADVTTATSKTHVQLYQRFAGMSRKELIMSATQMYAFGLRPFASAAGVEAGIDWSLSPRTLELYPDPLDDDDYATGVFGGALIAHDRASAFTRPRAR